MNIVLVAGGGGTRLWPLSRKKKPKQFITIGKEKTLIEQAYDRARKLTDASNVFVATLGEYTDLVRTILKELPPENIIIEPERRDNAAAIAAAAVRLTVRGYAETPTVFMWSDHIFTHPEEFITDAKKIPEILNQQPNAVVVMGHVPTMPETGFGYIEAGERHAQFADVYTVKSFKEKPDQETAENYVVTGNYFWNLGAVGVTPQHLLEELRAHEPELMKRVDKIHEALEKNDEEAAIAIYKTLPKASIDYALLEKTKPIYVVTGDYGWSDIGSWTAVHELLKESGDHMPQGHHVHIDSQNNLVYNTTEKAVSLIGVDDTVVVVTEDAVLVTHRDKTQKVKEIVAKLEEEAPDKYT